MAIFGRMSAETQARARAQREAHLAQPPEAVLDEVGEPPLTDPEPAA